MPLLNQLHLPDPATVPTTTTNPVNNNNKLDIPSNSSRSPMATPAPNSSRTGTALRRTVMATRVRRKAGCITNNPGVGIIHHTSRDIIPMGEEVRVVRRVFLRDSALL